MTRLVPLLALLIALSLALAGCSDGDSAADAPPEPADEPITEVTDPSDEPEPNEMVEPPAEPDPPPAVAEAGLPDYTAGFRDFTGLVSLNIPAGSAPHGGVKSVWANNDRETTVEDAFFPEGTIVVKEGERGGDSAAIIAVMRKVNGIDPEHGDWEFIEWSRSDPSSPYTVLAQDSVCWGCHAGAVETDWVFTLSSE